LDISTPSLPNPVPNELAETFPLGKLAGDVVVGLWVVPTGVLYEALWELKFGRRKELYAMMFSF
jgi:hypothetical protein